ncbi:hypothetical protein MHBO_004241 [Bonamia ostreae]|uniref:Phospholipid/glycerol acyltransferase domain-containing protein n=1 Tax=Bonamia ostreae TaxID=126728 RepID=A0ABV2ASR9_9EUKA
MPVNRWNWNFYLSILYSFGVIIRYLILFPIRLIILIIAFIIFLLSNFFIASIPIFSKQKKSFLRRKLAVFLAISFAFSWGSVVKFHGELPEYETNQIFVCNHTSMIDYLLLLQKAPFAVLGQMHGGWVGWMQKNILKETIGAVWFERDLPNDRKKTLEKIKQYIQTKSSEKSRLLIFPEGTCVGMKHCIQFKKGAFGMEAIICPIAIKYNEYYSNAYWNSRKKSFARHLFELMTSWAVLNIKIEARLRRLFYGAGEEI